MRMRDGISRTSSVGAGIVCRKPDAYEHWPQLLPSRGYSGSYEDHDALLLLYD